MVESVAVVALAAAIAVVAVAGAAVVGAVVVAAVVRAAVTVVVGHRPGGGGPRRRMVLGVAPGRAGDAHDERHPGQDGPRLAHLCLRVLGPSGSAVLRSGSRRLRATIPRKGGVSTLKAAASPSLASGDRPALLFRRGPCLRHDR